MTLLEKLRVVFLTVKRSSENCLCNKEHDHTDSTSLKDKQATISHYVHGQGQTSTDERLSGR